MADVVNPGQWGTSLLPTPPPPFFFCSYFSSYSDNLCFGFFFINNLHGCSEMVSLTFMLECQVYQLMSMKDTFWCKNNFSINSDVTWTCIRDCQPIEEETPCGSGRAALLSDWGLNKMESAVQQCVMLKLLHDTLKLYLCFKSHSFFHWLTATFYNDHWMRCSA